MSKKSAATRLFGLAVVVAVGVGVVYAVGQLRLRKEAADATVDRMQEEIDQLDPATRAMVRARLAADSVRSLRGSG